MSRLPSAEQAYWIGLLPRLIGVAFEGALLLDEAEVGAGPALAERIARLRRALADGREHRASTEQLERVLRASGLGPIAPPARPDGYAAWVTLLANRIREAAEQSTRPAAPDLERLAGYRAAWAHRLGTTVGEMLHVMRLGVMVNHLRDAEPERPFLVAHTSALGEAQRQALHGVERLYHGLHKLGEPAGAVGQLLLDLLKAPSIDAAESPRAIAVALQAVARAIDTKALAREAAQLLSQYDA